MKIEVLPGADAVSHRAAQWIAEFARGAVEDRGRFVLALSGGSTPREAHRILATVNVDWRCVELVQVDERAAPSGSEERNLTQLRVDLLERIPLPARQFHPMPVEGEPLVDAAVRYENMLGEIAGTPPVLDLVVLGLGLDGHTASLVPGDPVLQCRADVGICDVYQGRRRMTLTYPILNRARRILWLVTGAAKSEVLARLRRGDASLPGSRVRGDRALLLADRAASGLDEARA